MSAEIRTARNTNYRILKQKFEANDIFIPQIGRDFDRQSEPINPEDGSWLDRSLSTKTPGYIVQFWLDAGGNLKAGQFSTNATSGRIGYFNATNPNRKTGGVAVRIFPVFRGANGRFVNLLEWEWSLVLVFEHALTGGSSADTLNRFNPPTPSIEWKTAQTSRTVNIIGGNLFSLVDKDNEVTVNQGAAEQRTITYGDATVALNEFLSFDF